VEAKTNGSKKAYTIGHSPASMKMPTWVYGTMQH